MKTQSLMRNFFDFRGVSKIKIKVKLHIHHVILQYIRRKNGKVIE